MEAARDSAAAGPVPETEAELEAFRRQWRDEVSARNRKAAGAERREALEQRQASAPSHAGPSGARRKDAVDYSEDVEPRTYHDLPDQDEPLRLGSIERDHDRAVKNEPTSALEHYERAVEKETQGQLGDSMRHYRQAFKLDAGVQEAYTRKHFPPSAFLKKKPTGISQSAGPPNIGDHALHNSSAERLPATLKQLLEHFSSLKIEAIAPETSLSPQPRSPLAELPEEILIQVLTQVAVTDVASFARLASVCKHLAYLVLTEEAIWKRVVLGSEFGFGAMQYDYVCSIEGGPLQAPEILDDDRASHPDSHIEQVEVVVRLPTPAERGLAFAALTESLLHSAYASSWRQMFRSRPRVRFNGCYISTVNYTRAGGANTNTLTWGAPVHVVTYFRYLRFFRDGTAISLLTTAEPADVVHHISKDNLRSHHGSFLPSRVMRDALHGRWRLTGPHHSGSLRQEEVEREGDVLVETQGVNPAKYDYKMHLALAHAGKGTRNNKLAWKGFWSYNKLTDDWGEFGLRNDRAFYWSRVRSYGRG